ncbi:MAG: lipocalin family protein [Rikenellaceae bacterium]|nr:lipocalin family protein [Rikenellaceae bacterium]
MKKVLLIAISSLLMVACSKDDNKVEKDALVNTWELTYNEGFEVDDNDREEWSGTPKEYGIEDTYTFNADGTGTNYYVEYDQSDNKTYENTNNFRWSFNDNNNTLSIKYSYDTEEYTVEKLTSSEMILVQHEKDDNGYEYFDKYTYRKK